MPLYVLIALSSTSTVMLNILAIMNWVEIDIFNYVKEYPLIPIFKKN